MRSVPKKLLGCLAAGIIVSIATPAFTQQSSEVFIPPIVVPAPQSAPAAMNQQVLPPILSPDRVNPNSSSGMLQPISPQPELIVDRHVQPLDATIESAGRAVSSAGVPIYADGSAIRSQGVFNGMQPGLKNAAFFQGSGTRNAEPVFQESGIRNVPPIVNADSLTPGRAMSIAPGTINQQYPMPEIAAPESVVLPDIVDPPQFLTRPTPTAPTYQTPVNQIPGSIDYFGQPANSLYNSQSQCGGPCANTGCTNCGTGGCYDPAAVQNQFGCSGSVPNAGYYLFADLMTINRYDGDIQASNFFELSDFSWEAGGRFTLGYRQNATVGREIAYWGSFKDLEQTDFRNDPFNRLNAVFQPAGGFSGFEVSSFYNASRQVQTKMSEIHSLEYNRVKWGWDVLKTQFGIRYIYFDDMFTYFSENSGGNGTFNMHSINNLIGAQWGYQFFYDVGYRFSLSFSNNWGGYLNLADFDTLLANNGLVSIDKGIQDSHVASTIDLGFKAHYQLNPQVRLRAGYDASWLWGLFTVNNNFPRTSNNPFLIPRPEFVTPNTGSDLNTNNEAVSFNAFYIGLEFFR